MATPRSALVVSVHMLSGNCTYQPFSILVGCSNTETTITVALYRLPSTSTLLRSATGLSSATAATGSQRRRHSHCRRRRKSPVHQSSCTLLSRVPRTMESIQAFVPHVNDVVAGHSARRHHHTRLPLYAIYNYKRLDVNVFTLDMRRPTSRWRRIYQSRQSRYVIDNRKSFRLSGIG